MGRCIKESRNNEGNNPTKGKPDIFALLFLLGVYLLCFFFSPLGDIQSCHGEAFQYKQRLNRIMVKPTGYKPTTLSILT